MPSWHVELRKRPSGGTLDLEILKRKSWSGIKAEYVRIAAPATFDFKVNRSSNQIILYDLYRVDGETKLSGLPSSTTKDLRSKLTYVPAGCELEGWCTIEKSAAFATVMIDSGAKFQQHIDLTRLLPRLEFEDRMLRSVVLRFQAILDDPTLDIPGYSEALGDLLAFEIHRATSSEPRRPADPVGLNASQVQLVTEHMDSRLAEKVSISEYAALVNLTRSHFIRSFKQAVGIPPHQFLIRRRIERARELLEDERNSIAEVASKTGFGSPVQLTRAFRRVVGSTPSAFRRESI
jgi:AraC family transcriptional regulator